MKEKIVVGFRGLFFFVSFFWRSKRKKNAITGQKLKVFEDVLKWEKSFKINYL
ncbi:MAG: hypothetical protein Q8L90_12700 [Bacteroidota bacterium]|nr:hypothetical protein [Bacteroidota bacterium]